MHQVPMQKDQLISNNTQMTELLWASMQLSIQGLWPRGTSALRPPHQQQYSNDKSFCGHQCSNTRPWSRGTSALRLRSPHQQQQSTDWASVEALDTSIIIYRPSHQQQQSIELGRARGISELYGKTTSYVIPVVKVSTCNITSETSIR